jgi:hypothetical protein
LRLLRFFLQLTILLNVEQAFADPAYIVASYYQAGAYLTERFIPFAVKRVSDGKFVDEVVSVQIAKPCYAMTDPHRAYFFHVYCSEQTDSQFIVSIKDQGQLINIPLPPIQVQALALVSSTPKSRGKKAGPVQSLGKRLFTNNCVRCHTNLYPLPAHVTPAQLTSAFDAYTDMQGFKNTFTAAELSALANYINGGLK